MLHRSLSTAAGGRCAAASASRASSASGADAARMPRAEALGPGLRGYGADRAERSSAPARLAPRFFATRPWRCGWGSHGMTFAPLRLRNSSREQAQNGAGGTFKFDSGP